MLCILCNSTTRTEAQTAEKNTYNASILDGVRAAYTETKVVPAIEDELYIVEEVSYPADALIVTPAGQTAQNEIILLSEFIRENDRISYPITVNKAYTYKYYEITGQVICTASVTVTGLYYGTGNGEIVSVSCSFSGPAASNFSKSVSIPGNNTASLTVNFDVSGNHWDTTYYYTMTNDVIQ